MNKCLLCIIIFVITIIIFLKFYYIKIKLKNNLINSSFTYYINLEHRKDRNIETIKELKSFGINKANRFNAIKNNGSIGCAKSHLEILKLAQNIIIHMSLF